MYLQLFATNRIHEHGRRLSVTVTHPTTPLTGQPVRHGQMTGVALTDEGEGGNAATKTTVDFGPAVYDLSVKGVDDSGNAAVSVGDQLFYVDADINDGTGFLSKKVSGYFFGFALEAVNSGATSTINVLLVPSPGPGTADILAGAIGTSELASNAVTEPKIAAKAVTMAKLSAEVINKTGSEIGADKVVAISGLDATSGKPKIVLADADVAAHDDLWVTTAAIANDAEGTVAKSALSAANLNTNSVSAAGDPVYLDTTAGGFAVTAPTAANARVIPVGMVVVKSATVGQIQWFIGPVRKIGTDELQPQTDDGTNVKNVADDNVIGGIPVLHRIDITAGANADVDVTLTHKTRVIDAWVVLRGTGVASAVFTVKNGANAITDGMAASGADKAIVRAGEIDDAQHEIAAAGTLRVTGSGGASMPEATVYVLGIRVA